VAQAPDQKAIPLPATQYIPSHDYDTQNVQLNLRFNWDLEQAMGTATISFSSLVTNLRSIELDAANMTVSGVALRSGTSLDFTLDKAKQKLDVMLDRAYQPGESQTIVISYHTNGTAETRSINGGGGLTFIKPTKSDPSRPRQIWSQGESVYAHYWFPCYDNPNDFFTSEIIATVEKPLMVISNGRLIETKENNDGTRTYDWKIEQPHASYLTSIVVGEYVAVEGAYDGIPVVSYVYPSELEAGKITTSRLPEMVKFFSEKTGIKYPYAKYAQTMARDFNGGMENITATTQTDTMIHDARTELDQTSDSLESHELAHEWFGDYLTCRSWGDIWLNESFATYFQALWDEHHLGHNDFLYLDVGSNQDEYLTAWTRGLRRPIVTKNYANPDSVFDAYAYPRGGAVLHMLRKTLGDDNWWRAINYYLKKYPHQPVQTEQFRIAIEEATGQSMDRFFDQWLYRMGHPVFGVTQSFDPTAKTLKVTVRQEQKTDPGSAYPQVSFFKTPVEIEIGTTSGTHVERVTIEPQEEQSFTFKVDSEPLLVNFDYESTLIKELRFKKPTAALEYQMSRDADVMGRLWALDQLKDRMGDKSVAEAERREIAAAISAALRTDKFWGARVNMAKALEGVPGSDIRAALVAATKDVNSHARESAITALAASNDPALASLYETLLKDQSYAVIRAAARALGSTKSAGAFEKLSQLVDEPSWHGKITASALRGLDALGDKRALDLAVRFSSSNEPQVRAAALVLLASVGKNEPRTFGIISQAFADAAETQNLIIGAAAAEALVELGDPRGVALLSMVRKLVNNPEIQQLLAQQEERLQKKVSAKAEAVKAGSQSK
jgi:aminopeptidase N